MKRLVEMSVKKAALAAAFLRADPRPVAKDSIANFHASLEHVISTGTNASIQVGNELLLDHIVPVC